MFLIQILNRARALKQPEEFGLGSLGKIQYILLIIITEKVMAKLSLDKNENFSMFIVKFSLLDFENQNQL